MKDRCEVCSAYPDEGHRIGCAWAKAQDKDDMVVGLIADLAAVRRALEELSKKLRSSASGIGGGYGPLPGKGMRRHACSSCDLTDSERDEIDGYNKALTVVADTIDALLAPERPRKERG